MKNVGKRAFTVLTTILFLSSMLILQVYSPAVIITPIDTTITVASADTFILAYKMSFDEADPGFFSITFYWDNNETAPDAPYWNFTYLDFVSKFVDGTSFSGSINVTIKKEVPHGYPSGYYRYTVSVTETYGEDYNGDFWINVTMWAAGTADGVWYPHAEGDQNITISKVRCNENTILSVGPGNATIHVTEMIDVHDVAVIDVALSSTEVYSGGVVNVTATVRNEGTVTETFNVTAYYGATVIGTETVVNLTTWTPTNLTFSWNTTGVAPCTNYTVRVEADVVPGEIDIGDNVYVDGTVKVKMFGDINGDGIIDIVDIVIVALAFGAKPGDPNWNPDADLRPEWGLIDIVDMVYVAIRFGDTC
ncbi:MAG: CARDB domain-containing protein [Candidatus Bathyarchaeia archaeon]